MKRGNCKGESCRESKEEEKIVRDSQVYGLERKRRGNRKMDISIRVSIGRVEGGKEKVK